MSTRRTWRVRTGPVVGHPARGVPDPTSGRHRGDAAGACCPRYFSAFAKFSLLFIATLLIALSGCSSCDDSPSAPTPPADLGPADVLVPEEDLPPPPESCDGHDNDNDGETDETFACVLGRSEDCESGCGPGRRTCLRGCAWSECSPLQVDEVCNGVDDNCNGQIDEGLPCQPGQTRPCRRECGPVGEQVCGEDCRWGKCSEFELPCDHLCLRDPNVICLPCTLDDDGDGYLDDGVLTTGPAIPVNTTSPWAMVAYPSKMMLQNGNRAIAAWQEYVPELDRYGIVLEEYDADGPMGKRLVLDPGEEWFRTGAPLLHLWNDKIVVGSAVHWVVDRAITHIIWGPEDLGGARYNPFACDSGSLCLFESIERVDDPVSGAKLDLSRTLRLDLENGGFDELESALEWGGDIDVPGAGGEHLVDTERDRVIEYNSLNYFAPDRSGYLWLKTIEHGEYKIVDGEPFLRVDPEGDVKRGVKWGRGFFFEERLYFLVLFTERVNDESQRIIDQRQELWEVDPETFKLLEVWEASIIDDRTCRIGCVGVVFGYSLAGSSCGDGGGGLRHLNDLTRAPILTSEDTCYILQDNSLFLDEPLVCAVEEKQ